VGTDVLAGRRLLILAGALSAGIALLHVACILIGPAAYRYFGAGERLASLAAAGSPVPALITAGIAAVFAVFGLYAFSGAGLVPRLPLLRTGLIAVGAVFTPRGLFLPLEIMAMLARPGAIPSRELVFSAVSLVIGLAYLGGATIEWRRPGRRTVV
jgi:hypothetical protein